MTAAAIQYIILYSYKRLATLYIYTIILYIYIPVRSKHLNFEGNDGYRVWRICFPSPFSSIKSNI